MNLHFKLIDVLGDWCQTPLSLLTLYIRKLLSSLIRIFDHVEDSAINTISLGTVDFDLFGFRIFYCFVGYVLVWPHRDFNDGHT
jgi:hypothetical protein